MSIINYNYASNAAANVITTNERLMDKTMARISSGSRVGAGNGDSGTYALYTNMSIEGKEACAALTSLNSGLARMKLVEATGMTIHKMAVRMQELATTASNALLPDQARPASPAAVQHRPARVPHRRRQRARGHAAFVVHRFPLPEGLRAR